MRVLYSRASIRIAAAFRGWRVRHEAGCVVHVGFSSDKWMISVDLLIVEFIGPSVP